MTFKLGRVVQHCLIGDLATGDKRAQLNTRDDGGGAAAETAREWDFVVNF
jgi:hypothetical protein